MIVLPAAPVAQRRRLRQELGWQGFGELGNGVFAHPELPARALAWQIREANLPERTLVFEADLASPATPASLIRLGWDLKDLARRYQRFVERFGQVHAALGPRVDPEIGFIVRTLLIHEYRRLHLRDPLLPARLLPADWPGLKAAELCRSIYARVFAPSEAHFSAWPQTGRRVAARRALHLAALRRLRRPGAIEPAKVRLTPLPRPLLERCDHGLQEGIGLKGVQSAVIDGEGEIAQGALHRSPRSPRPDRADPALTLPTPRMATCG